MYSTKARTNYRYLILLFWVLAFYGCSSGLDGERATLSGGGEGVNLQRARSCPDLEKYIKSIVMLEQQNMGGYRKYINSGADIVTVTEDQGTPVNGESAGEYSTTNVQEEGVDEADFVKNDGSHIYVLNKGNFYILKAWPPEDALVISTTVIEGYPTEMFVHNDKALIFSNVDFDVVKKRFNLPDEGTEGNIGEGQLYPSIYSPPMTKVTVLDITDKTAPKLERETYLEANYLNSRMVNDTVHFVGYSSVYDPFYYNGCIDYAEGGTVVSVNAGGGEGGIETTVATGEATIPSEGAPSFKDADCISETEYLKLLEERLAETDYTDLLPKYYNIVYGAGGEIKSQDILCSCDNFYKPAVINGKDVVSVVSFNLKTGEFNTTAIIGQWGTLYASANSLYLASYIFDYWVNAIEGEKEKAEEYSTIHKFDISSDPDRAEYIASGKVSGQILNQFSMSEYEGFLRVATTKNQDWLTGEGSKNNIFVLNRNGPALEVAGAVTGIAPTERIYSARFIKDKGYVVTFRQVDPMFTVDLSDPFNPEIAGELKVPGFSTYLHPMGDDHILAIGRDATEQGQVKGLKLSIFDVGDFKNPRLLHETTLGQDWGSNSEAAYNHKAFNYFADKDLLAIPFSYYNWQDYMSEEENFNGLIAFNVTIEDGFKEMGKIDHKDLFTIDPQYKPCYYDTGVGRSIIMDDYIYSLSEWGVKSNLLPDLKEVRTIPYPDSNPQDYYYCGYY